MDPSPISIKTTRRVCGTGRRRWHDAEITGHGHPRFQGKDRGRQVQLRITIPAPAQPYGTQGATHGEQPQPPPQPQPRQPPQPRQKPPATVDSSSSESSAAAGFIGSTRCITFAVSSIVLIWTFGGVVIPRSLSTAAGSDRSRSFNASSAHASATSRPQRSSQSPPRACSVGFSAILCNLQSEGSITAQVTEHDGFPSDFPRAGPPRGHDLARHGEGPSHTSLIEF